MSRNGSGQFSLVTNSWNPATNGQLASAGDWQALINDIAASITQSLSRDGQGGMTGNLPMGGNSITGLSDASGTGQALTFAQLFNQGTEADLASAATTDIGAQLTNFLRITGTTTITSFGTNYKGPRFLRFAGAVLLTNSATLALPGGANITTAAGDCLIAIPTATLGTADGWRVVAYQKNAVPGTVADGSISTAKLSTDLQNATYGFKNRIINGAMMIDQRNAGASVASPSDQFITDRFALREVGGGVASAQQVFTSASSGNAPAGFVSSLKLVVTTADASIASTDRYFIRQPIEGLNVADMNFGTANASTFTLSFWVRSSVTGTFPVAFRNNDNTRSYVATYTISAADTWEQKTVTVAGDQSGTWISTSLGAGVNVVWTVGAGSTYNTTANAWQAGDYLNTSGTTQWIATSGATFYITGVQLEKGSTATSFDYRPYGTELALCQRYYQRWSFQTNGDHLGNGQSSGGSQSRRVNWSTMTTMRSTPSLSYSGTITAYIAAGTGTTLSSLGYSGGSTPWRISVDMNTAGSCGTAGDMNFVLFSSGSWLDASSEL